ncbi:hypothetical protein TNCV_3862371 [Trichonephila clavipes]|uniref:Uncharacterized protein n=1 Tax=Trichonephila clavipes TaxID=2585209 RepID=A0A8X6SCH3_TRICX|nr:hypothetical protein TNCV_3862371 [Trichonephila clavipes]
MGLLCYGSVWYAKVRGGPFRWAGHIHTCLRGSSGHSRRRDWSIKTIRLWSNQICRYTSEEFKRRNGRRHCRFLVFNLPLWFQVLFLLTKEPLFLVNRAILQYTSA